MQENQDKLAQFNQFFTIEHQFNININVIDQQQISDYDSFLDNIPAPFKLMNEMGAIDQAALRPLQAISGVAAQLVNYLNHQAQKIDLLMGYILSQQDEAQSRFQGVSFGGAGIAFLNKTAFEQNTLVEVKIFLPSENCAIYSVGEIIAIEQQNEQFHHKLLFHFIRDEDRELLVRASLHKQTKQLQQLAKQRQQKSSE